MAITAPSAPPARGTRRSAAKVNDGPLTGKAAGYFEDLTGLGQMVSAVLIIKGQFADAGAISVHGPAMFTEVARLGAQDDRIGKILDYLGNVGPYAALIGAALPFALQIMVNHKVIGVPPGIDSVVPAEQLEAEVRTAIAIRQAEAIKAQQEAEAKLAALKAQSMPVAA